MHSLPSARITDRWRPAAPTPPAPVLVVANAGVVQPVLAQAHADPVLGAGLDVDHERLVGARHQMLLGAGTLQVLRHAQPMRGNQLADRQHVAPAGHVYAVDATQRGAARSEEHTSELQSLMRISYAVFCLK